MTMLELEPNSAGGHVHDGDAFNKFRDEVTTHFERMTSAFGNTLFTTAADNLFDLYVSALPASERAIHNCGECRRFIERFGSLVVIDSSGRTFPAVWPETAPGIYAPAARALNKAVAKAVVNGVFVSSDPRWGTPKTGTWTHFALKNPVVFKHPLNTAEQVMAEKLEHHGTLSRALSDFTLPKLQQAMTILKAEKLASADRFIGPVQFLMDLQEAMDQNKSRKKNLVWLAVSKAPPGFCTPRSSMVGTLLNDIADGYPFADIQRRFNAKMHPLQYQRAQVEATAGNIKQAEQIFEKMGLAASLQRRFALLEEIHKTWAPRPIAEFQAAKEGVFGDLKRKGQKAPDEPLNLPPTIMTWEKFTRTVLPEALSIDVRMEYSMDFGGILTAADPDAPPILQWDLEDQRNPFSWYQYINGSAPGRFELMAGTWVEATGICDFPAQWYGKYDHQPKAPIVLLKGARDKRITELALFPSTVRSELHSVRSTIENYSKTHKPTGIMEATACGVMISSPRPVTLRVRTKTGVAPYKIDRLD